MDEQIAHLVEHENALLNNGFDGNEALGRAAHGFCNGLDIGRIAFATLDAGLWVGGRHEPNGMPELDLLVDPVMSGRADLRADQPGCELGKKGQDFGLPQRPAHEDLALSVDAVDLEDVLRQIKSDGADLCYGRLLRMRTSGLILAQRCREQRPSTPSLSYRLPACPSLIRLLLVSAPAKVKASRGLA